jgi:hypothetical protein
MRRILPVLILCAPVVTSAQARPPVERLGSVHFPVSCSSSVATDFDRAVALLHSFEFGEAIKGFQSVLAVDSTCAMAYWGIAMSMWSNPMSAGNRSQSQLRQGLSAVNSARRVAAHGSPRELGYVEAVARLYDDFDRVSQSDRVSSYSRAMEMLSNEQPADTEAKIFYAISLVAAASPADKSYANQNKAGALLESLWKLEPNHPGLAHYIIHAYDYPALAKRASAAARDYAVIAPSAAHALHMPSHIFTRTGAWKQSVETNSRSMQVAKATGSIAEALHAADYSVYAYLQLGNDAAAKRILDELPSLAARFDVNAITGAAPGSAGVFALAAIPARYALERDAWGEASALDVRPSSFLWTDAMTYFARALGAARIHDIARTQAAADSLHSIRSRLASGNEPYWTEQVAIQETIALAWLALARSNADSALTLMKEAARREDATEKSAVTPGPLAPARELLGDMLIELKRPAEALSEYRKTLEKEPSRRRSMIGVERASRLSNKQHE